ncbi:hypothetical protein AG1IA_10485 [Rhizoctonia solani AG-1 IA]|uniref:Uncharacterized protein n=1 Tax=Thanatephorus cucumeris (strain AG1-IA) TaxID=983506 RepID=L8WBZ5_THACA|nr:hypothetical protein AG1IA_10485 [Rhizoctonia solani AG-1 IA]
MAMHKLKPRPKSTSAFSRRPRFAFKFLRLAFQIDASCSHKPRHFLFLFSKSTRALLFRTSPMTIITHALARALFARFRYPSPLSLVFFPPPC